MLTTLTRLKTLFNDNKVDGATLSYVKHVEIAPTKIDLITVSVATLPTILIVPQNSSEVWVASQEKQATHAISLYAILQYFQRESSLIGDSSRPAGQGKGIVNFIEDILSVVRGHRLAIGGVNYLTKPIDILNIRHTTQEWGENAYLVVGEISIQAARLFTQQTLPGNI